MNPTLAALYGTGMDKVASEEEGEFDLSELSDDELMMLLDVGEADHVEADEEDTLSKMASQGDLEYWDMAGRIMAHAYTDEMDKVAGTEEIEPLYFDLNELDADDLYTLAMEKEAGMRSMMSGMSGMANKAGARMRSMMPRRRAPAAPAAAPAAPSAAPAASEAMEELTEAATKAAKGGSLKATGVKFKAMTSRIPRFGPRIEAMSDVNAGKVAVGLAGGTGLATVGTGAYAMRRRRS